MILDVIPGYSLPRKYYRDPDIHERDMRIFFREWLFAGPSARIPGAGDYFTVELGDESIIVARDEDGTVNAMANVCRHRGSKICLKSAGHAKVFVCPYHQWVYSSSGELQNARLMESGFDTKEFGLHRFAAKELEGLIFICLAQEPPPFDEFAEAMTPRLRYHNLRLATVAHVARYDIRANWKLVLENSRECYHCGAGHPQYARAVGFAAAIGSSEIGDAQRQRETEGFCDLAARDIVTEEIPFRAPSDWFHYRRFFLRPGMRTESMDGEPVAPLMAREPGWDAGVFAVIALPTLLLEASPDYVMTMRMLPAGPQLTTAEICWLAAPGAQAAIDFDVEKMTEFWRLTAEQDWALCEGNQAGVNSVAYQPGPYAPSEAGVSKLIGWYVRQLELEGA